MANAAHVNRRLIQSLARSPTYTGSCWNPYRSPITWVRTITNTPSRSSQSTLTISFGAETDALLAPHLQKLKEKESKAKSRRNGKIGAKSIPGKGNIEPVEPKISTIAAADNFEIAEYVNLSVERPRHSRTAGDPSSTSKSEASLASVDTIDQSLSGKRKSTGRKSPKSTDQLPSTENPSSRRSVGAKPGISTTSYSTTNLRSKTREPWQIQKTALKEKFGEDGWNPRKKLSPDAIEGIRGLHEQDPVKYTTDLLATQFKVSPEAIRRILRSKWSQTISPDKMHERRERWARRHDRIWDRQSELGLRPARVKDRKIEDPDQFEKDMTRRQMLGEI